MIKKALTVLALVAALAATADTYNYLTIKQNGKTISLPLESVESVTFTVDDETTPEEDPALEYELRVLTFEDVDYKGYGNYLGISDWSSLIDTPQYGGPLLYGDYTTTQYSWYDQNNTELCAAIDPNGAGLVYWSGGEAISNYVNPNYTTSEIDYAQQLSTPAGGYMGSSNFCVHNGYFDGIFYTEPQGGIWFHDGKARVIDHMYVALTSYVLSTGILGSAYSTPATEDDWMKLVAIGTDAEGNTRQVELPVCTNGKFVESWQKWDLSSLGQIVRLDFNVTSSMYGQYGLNIPAYFAYDDIVVRFPKN